MTTETLPVLIHDSRSEHADNFLEIRGAKPYYNGLRVESLVKLTAPDSYNVIAGGIAVGQICLSAETVKQLTKES